MNNNDTIFACGVGFLSALMIVLSVAVPLDRIVCTPRIRTAVHYYEALHEIGHVLTTTTANSPGFRKLMWSINHKKVTRFTIRDEHAASSTGLKLRTLGSHTDCTYVFHFNQLAYIHLYEKAWNTAFTISKYMSFVTEP